MIGDIIEWGPEIPVDEKRPDWLDDSQICRPRWGDDTWYGRSGAPADCVRGWSDITAIKLPAHHPIYGTPPVADDAGEPVAERPTKTLRDEFAMAALAGLLGSEAAHGPIMQGNPTAAAVFCFEMADAMLAERERGQ